MDYIKLSTKDASCHGHKHVGIVIFTVEELDGNPNAKDDAEKWRKKMHEACSGDGQCRIQHQETTYLLKQGNSPRAIKVILEGIRRQAKREATVHVRVFEANKNILEEVH